MLREQLEEQSQVLMDSNRKVEELKAVVTEVSMCVGVYAWCAHSVFDVS